MPLQGHAGLGGVRCAAGVVHAPTRRHLFLRDLHTQYSGRQQTGAYAERHCQLMCCVGVYQVRVCDDVYTACAQLGSNKHTKAALGSYEYGWYLTGLHCSLPACLLASRRAVNFGNVSCGATASRVVYLTNHTDVPALYDFQVCVGVCLGGWVGGWRAGLLSAGHTCSGCSL